MENNLTKKFILIGVMIGFLSYGAYCLADMSSSSYKVSADTVNGGGDLSQSANFHEGDSLGEAAIGEEQSANYKSKTAFWYMSPGGSPYGLNCLSNSVYMVDYTLGNANNYNKYLFSPGEECVVTAYSGVPWTLTVQSSNMTSARNNLSNASVFVSTNGNVSTGDTVTTPASITTHLAGVTEPSTGDYALNAPKTIISGDGTAIGTYDNQPTIKISNLNNLFAETISGTLTITIQ